MRSRERNIIREIILSTEGDITIEVDMIEGQEVMIRMKVEKIGVIARRIDMRNQEKDVIPPHHL